MSHSVREKLCPSFPRGLLLGGRSVTLASLFQDSEQQQHHHHPRVQLQPHAQAADLVSQSGAAGSTVPSRGGAGGQRGRSSASSAPPEATSGRGLSGVGGGGGDLQLKDVECHL